jgi:streptomycin 6-kinase
MDKTIDRDQLAAWTLRWRLEPDGEPFATHSSVLLPARRDGRPVMLKLTPEPDEIRGGALLAWWDGRGAVRVLEREADAILMERPTGTRSLVEMSMSGRDHEAIDVLCSAASELHRPSADPLPPLDPVENLFTPLLASDWDDPIVQFGRRIAHGLFADPIEQVPLHGDIQHYNVLDAGDGRWLAIDPKGQYGERTYDFVNLFRNPNGTIGNDPAIFGRRMAQIERCAELDPSRLARWIVAFCALCLVWDYYPQGSSASDRELANLALAFDAEQTNRT